MNRRDWFSRTFGTIAAACVAPFAVKAIAAAPTPAPLAFHSDAFAFSFAPFPSPVTRMDVIYGFGTLSPSLGGRVFDEPEPRGSFLNYIAAERDLLG